MSPMFDHCRKPRHVDAYKCWTSVSSYAIDAHHPITMMDTMSFSHLLQWESDLFNSSAHPFIRLLKRSESVWPTHEKLEPFLGIFVKQPWYCITIWECISHFTINHWFFWHSFFFLIAWNEMQRQWPCSTIVHLGHINSLADLVHETITAFLEILGTENITTG